MRFQFLVLVSLAVSGLFLGQNTAQQTKPQAVVVKGAVKDLKFVAQTPVGFWTERHVYFYLRPDTEITFSDKQKAKPSDLRIGQRLRVHANSGELSQKRYPQSSVAYAVIIEKENGVVRPLLIGSKEEFPYQVAREVDFTKEYVLIYHWKGSARDDLTFAIYREE